MNRLVGYIPSDANLNKPFPINDMDGRHIATAVVLKHWNVKPRADGSCWVYQLRARDLHGRSFTGRTTGPGGDFRGRPLAGGDAVLEVVS